MPGALPNQFHLRAPTTRPSHPSSPQAAYPSALPLTGRKPTGVPTPPNHAVSSFILYKIPRQVQNKQTLSSSDKYRINKLCHPLQLERVSLGGWWGAAQLMEV